MAIQTIVGPIIGIAVITPVPILIGSSSARTYSRASGSYARANSREGVPHARSQHVRNSTMHHQMREHQR
jgi:hypothetical protein